MPYLHGKYPTGFVNNILTGDKQDLSIYYNRLMQGRELFRVQTKQFARVILNKISVSQNVADYSLTIIIPYE